MHYAHQGSRRYLYQSYRDAEGNVRRRYLGTGAVAEYCLLEYQTRKAEEAERREQLQQLLDEVGQTQREARDFAQWVELLTRSGLVQAGYYLHYRSQWRARNAEAKTNEKEASDANQGGVPGVGPASER